MRLDGRPVREACGMLGWSRYDVQQRTALSLVSVDLLTSSTDGLNGTEADEVILMDAFQRAGLTLDAACAWLRSKQQL